MTKPFFVLALPRSLTSWLSVWLSYRSLSVCDHDILPQVGVDAIVDVVERRAAAATRDGYRYGLSDSGLLMCWRTVAEQWPDASWLLVKRAPADVYQSLHRLLHDAAPLEWDLVSRGFALALRDYAEELHQAEAELPNTMVCTPAQILNDPQPVWRHLLRLAWDQRHFDRLASFNIQPTVESVVAALRGAR